MKVFPRILFAAVSLTLGSLAAVPVAHAQYYFQGATSTDPTDPTNYYQNNGPAYVNGSVTTTTQFISQAPYAGHDLVFSAALNTSTFGYLYDGQYANGNVTVTGSTINFGTSGGSGAQNVLGLSGNSGTMTVSGGTVNFLAGDTGDGTSLWIGNAANGTFTQTGGTVTTQNGLDIARDGGNGTLNISGGLFNVQGATGTIAENQSGGGTATLNFLPGNGIFRESTSAVFSTAVAVNFSYQTGSVFELTSSTNTFGTLATAGDLYYQTTNGGSFTQLDNTPTDSNYYGNFLSVSFSGGLEILGVAVVPEPTTWFAGLFTVGAGFVCWKRRPVAPAAI